MTRLATQLALILTGVTYASGVALGIKLNERPKISEKNVEEIKRRERLMTVRYTRLTHMIAEYVDPDIIDKMNEQIAADMEFDRITQDV